MRNSILAALSIAAVACSNAEPAAQDPGLELPRVENRETNSYQVAYPTADLGTQMASWKNWNSKTAHERTAPGQRMRNYKFIGHLEADLSSPLTTVALADYYDPEQKHADGPIKVIHVQAAGVWCSACRSEAASLRPLYSTLREQGVVWLTTVCEGKTPGTESTLADLTSWISSTKSQNTTVLDPGNANLGIFYKAAAIPWNAWIDARTMEIMHYQEGAPSDLKGYIDNALAKFAANPARD